MLLQQFLVGGSAQFVLLRITPAIQEVTAFAVASARVTGGLRRGELVINHPQLAVAAHAQHDLVELGIVVNAVHVIPEFLHLSAGWITINQLDVIAHDAVIILGVVKILDEVVPSVPFPDDDSIRRAISGNRLHFDHKIRQHESAVGGDFGAQGGRIEPGGEHFGVRLHFARDHEHVAIG